MCTVCPTELGLSIVWTIAAALLGAAALCLFIYLSRKSHKGGLRPIMNAWQTLSVVLMTNNEWPASVKFVQQYVLQTVNLDMVSLASPACLGTKMNFFHRFIASILGSCLLVGGPFLLSIKTFWHRKRNAEAAEKWETAKALRVHDSVLLVLLIYTMVTGACV